MARSMEFGKKEIKEYLKSKYDRDITILDVGCGEGTYFNLLYPYYTNIEGVEIYKPNIDNYELELKYKKVYNKNIVDMEYNYYDVIIFGDVIEHLSVEDAKKVLKYALPRCKELIVAVPYRYQQGEVDGNEYERHIQDDLTPYLMKKRYPYLELMFGNNEYGYYKKRDDGVGV